MLAYPATLLVTYPSGEQLSYQDPAEAEMCLEDLGKDNNNKQSQMKQRINTPGKPPQINIQSYYTPKRQKQKHC